MAFLLVDETVTKATMKSVYVTAIGIVIIAIIGLAAIGGTWRRKQVVRHQSALSQTTTMQSQTSSPTTTTSRCHNSSGQGRLAMQMTDPVTP